MLPAAPDPGPDEVVALARIAQREAGIALDAGKSEFLRARLAGLLSARGASDFRTYLRVLESDPDERVRFVEALTTHTTGFFREAEQYAWLEESGLPELLSRRVGRERDLVLWSAACSTGQEGYTALMIAERMSADRPPAFSCRLIGTDISRPVLRRAEAAIYTIEEVGPIPLDLRRRFLLSARNGDGRCRVVPKLRSASRWRNANLMQARDLDGIEADVIFLRNVLIYFDPPTQARVIDNVTARLRPGGYLLTGHTEAACARRPGLTALRPAIYRKDP